MSTRGPEAAREPTEVEMKIIHFLAWGHTSKDIAAQLGRSLRMVEAQRASARNAILAKSLADITRYAIEHELRLPICDPLVIYTEGQTSTTA